MSIYVNSVSNAIYTLISSNSTIVNSGFCVELDEELNSDPNNTPWIGVYLNNVSLVPQRLGVTNLCNGWNVRYDYSIFVQDMSMSSGREAKDNLHKGLTLVFDAINADHTLQGTVNTITELNISPFDRTLEQDEWFFSDEIKLIAEVDG